MGADDPVGIAERSPEAVLDFWLGRLRAPADASRENWQQAMRRWRVGPFARSTLAPNDLRVQREWCEQMHREGVERFFRRPGLGHSEGHSGEIDRSRPIPAKRLSRHGSGLCERSRDRFDFPPGLRNRLGVGALQRYRAHMDVFSSRSRRGLETAGTLRRENGAHECRPHRRGAARPAKGSTRSSAGRSSRPRSSTPRHCFMFGRFPHRNAALLRPHRGGERRYLTNPARPLWSFSQPLEPGLLRRVGRLAQNGRRIRGRPDNPHGARRPASSRGALAGRSGLADGYLRLRRATTSRPIGCSGGICGLPEHAQTLERLQQLPLVADLRKAVRSHVVKAGDRSWPPRSTTPAIDVAALSALVRADGPSDARRTGVRTEGDRGRVVDGRRAAPDRSPEAAPSLSLVVRNGRGELERVAEALDGFADRHGLPQQDRFQLQALFGRDAHVHRRARP